MTRSTASEGDGAFAPSGNGRGVRANRGSGGVRAGILFRVEGDFDGGGAGKADRAWQSLRDWLLESCRREDLKICDDQSLLLVFDGSGAATAARRRILDSGGGSRGRLRAPTPLVDRVSVRELRLRPEDVTARVLESPWGEDRDGHNPALTSAVKRAVDLVGAAVGLILLAPLIALSAAGIRLTSAGPILFRQKRIGKDGVEFTMLKFRTMGHGASEEPHRAYMRDYIGSSGPESQSQVCAKMAQDRRVYPFGAFLRRWSLDELPQLLNVVQGTMSLVGPRPSVHYELDHYQEWHRERLRVKPGLTGLWQVYGRGRTTFDEMTRMDIRYVRSWSFWNDLKLIVLTLPAALSRKGAH